MSEDEELDLQAEKESKLRDRILEKPWLLPGFKRPLAAAKEVPVRRAGKADLIVVDADGRIAIVECKKASNPQSRRYVIAQVLEYAAGLWRCGYDDLKDLFDVCGASLTEPFEVDVDWNEDTFRQAISQNLNDASFWYFIAVDEMTDRLEKRLNRTVTLLNGRLPILAIEVTGSGEVVRYGEKPEDIEALKPRSKQSRALGAVIDEIDDSVATGVAEKLFQWVQERNQKSLGVRVRVTDASAGIVEVSDPPQPRAGRKLFVVRPSGVVRVSLGAVVEKDREWNDSTKTLVQRLEDLGFHLAGGGNQWRRRPEAALELLAEGGKCDEFLDLMAGHLDAVAKA